MYWTWRCGALANELHARLLGVRGFDQWQPAGATPQAPASQWRTVLALPDIPPDHVLIPSFATLGDTPYGFRFTLTHAAGRASLSHIGELGAAAAAQTEGAGIDAPIDCFVSRAPVHGVTLELLLDAPAPPAGDTLLCVSCRPWGFAPVTGSQVNVAPLVAPSLSQRELPERMQHSACSPACMVMALAALGHEVDGAAFADAVRHEGIYGVWPANLYAASRRGVLGFVASFTHADDAVTLLDAHLPVIASTRWQEGDLTDGALAKSGGHLILLRGFSTDQVLVNDPAAGTAAEVGRGYARDEFCRIWLRERGAAYVLLP